MAEHGEAKSVKIFRILIFDGELRFALLASLRSAIFSEIKEDNLLVILLEEVNH